MGKKIARHREHERSDASKSDREFYSACISRARTMGEALVRTVDVLESTMKQDNPPSEVTVLQYFDAGWGRQILGSFLTILMPWTLFFSKHGLCDKPAGIYHATGNAKTCLQFVAAMDLESTLGVQVLAHRGGSREPLLPATGKTVHEILDSCGRHPSEPDASDSAET